MHLFQNTKQMSMTHNALTLLAAITLTIAVATDALAAGLGGDGGHGGGGFGGGHISGGFGGPLLGRVPSIPPVLNPSSQSTLPESPETPVSPASPHANLGGHSVQFTNKLHSEHHRHWPYWPLYGDPGYWQPYDMDVPPMADSNLTEPTPAPIDTTPETQPAQTCHRSEKTVTVPSEDGGTRQITIVHLC